MTRIKRKQRGEIYTDEELVPYFAEMAKGYCCGQTDDRCGYSRQKVMDTIYSDDEVFEHVIDLSMVAGAKIRKGELEVPDRYDGLYDKYKK